MKNKISIFKILGFLLIFALIVIFVVLDIKGEIVYWKWMISLPVPWNIVVIAGSVLLLGFVIISVWTCISSKTETKENSRKNNSKINTFIHQ